MNDEGFEINIFVIDKHPVTFLSLLSKEVGWVFICFLSFFSFVLHRFLQCTSFTCILKEESIET